jgi:hypothetical protein
MYEADAAPVGAAVVDTPAEVFDWLAPEAFEEVLAADVEVGAVVGLELVPVMVDEPEVVTETVDLVESELDAPEVEAPPGVEEPVPLTDCPMQLVSVPAWMGSSDE